MVNGGPHGSLLVHKLVNDRLFKLAYDLESLSVKYAKLLIIKLY